MSNAIFPTIPLNWSRTVSPNWSTKIQKSVSGREVRASYFSAPIVKRSLSCDVLRKSLSELDTLIGFFNARKGSFDSWLYTDPDDFQVTGQVFATGNGSTKEFQLSRTRGGHNEPVMNLNGTPTIYINGTPTTSFTASNGLITFTTAPSAGGSLSWTGSYYYRCRFASDYMDFGAIANGLWDSKKIEFLSCLGNRI